MTAHTDTQTAGLVAALTNLPRDMASTYGLSPWTDQTVSDVCATLAGVVHREGPEPSTGALLLAVVEAFAQLAIVTRDLEVNLNLARGLATPEQVQALAADDRVAFELQDMPTGPPMG